MRKTDKSPNTSIKRDRRGFRGLPPPLENFSLSKLSSDTLLTPYETAAILRVSTNTLESWRRVSGHPLRWSSIANGRIRYTAGDVRAFLAGEGRKLRAGQHEPERKPAAGAPKRTPKPPARRRADSAADDRPETPQ
jgi:hypothetical protein